MQLPAIGILKHKKTKLRHLVYYTQAGPQTICSHKVIVRGIPMDSSFSITCTPCIAFGWNKREDVDRVNGQIKNHWNENDS